MSKVVLFMMWLAASAGAVGVAWAGVSVVDNQIIAPPAADDVGFLVAGVDTTTGGSSVPGSESNTSLRAESASSSTTQATVDDSSNSSSTRPTAPPASASVSNPSTTSPPTTASTSTTASSSTTAPSSTAPTLTTAPTSTAAPTTAATTRTFSLTGGTAAVSFSASGVEVLWATPNPGFDVEIEPESPGIKVEFRADHHRSRLDAWWSGGPQHTIREEPRD